MNKYSSNNSKRCVLEVDLEYPKELPELPNDYPLAPDRIEMKRKILSDYQLKIAHLYNISIGNAKKLVPNLFNQEKNVLHYKNLLLYLRLGLKLKKARPHIRVQSTTMVKAIYWIQHTKRNRNGKKWMQRQKSAVQITEKCVCWKTMENFRNRIVEEPVHNKKYYLKCTSKPSYMLQ